MKNAVKLQTFSAAVTFTSRQLTCKQGEEKYVSHYEHLFTQLGGGGGGGGHIPLTLHHNVNV